MLYLASDIMTGVDPTPYTAWGVLGLLGFAFIALILIVYRLFSRQTSSMENISSSFMEFVDRHRSETLTGMQRIGDMVGQSNEKMVAAFNRQARALDEVLMVNRLMDQIVDAKKQGISLTPQEMQRIVQAVAHERAIGRNE